MSVKLKVIFIGESNVGKTALAYLCTLGTEMSTIPSITLGADLSTKYIKFENKTILVEIWDTAGAEEYRTLAPSYIRNSDAIFIVYDITKRDTFKSLEYWFNESNRYADDSVTRFVLGNKVDLPENYREVNMKEGQKYAKTHDMQFYETSKGDPQLEKIFVNVLKEVAKNKFSEEIHSNISLFDTPPMKQEQTCCNLNQFNFSIFR